MEAVMAPSHSDNGLQTIYVACGQVRARDHKIGTGRFFVSEWLPEDLPTPPIMPISADLL
jgi:hypothetical protein